jgi:hypothetical protein
VSPGSLWLLLGPTGLVSLMSSCRDVVRRTPHVVTSSCRRGGESTRRHVVGGESTRRHVVTSSGRLTALIAGTLKTDTSTSKGSK